MDTITQRNLSLLSRLFLLLRVLVLRVCGIVQGLLNLAQGTIYRVHSVVKVLGVASQTLLGVIHRSSGKNLIPRSCRGSNTLLHRSTCGRGVRSVGTLIRVLHRNDASITLRSSRLGGRRLRRSHRSRLRRRRARSLRRRLRRRGSRRRSRATTRRSRQVSTQMLHLLSRQRTATLSRQSTKLLRQFLILSAHRTRTVHQLCTSRSRTRMNVLNALNQTA